MHRTSRLAVLAALPALGILLPVPAAALGARVSEKALEDTQVGYSIKPILGWEATPRKNPDDPFARAEVGGWYAKNDPERRPSCTVLAFGSFFPEEEARRVATATAAPPEQPPSDGPGGDDSPGDGGDEDGEGKGVGEGDARKPAPRTLKEKFGEGPKSFDEYLEKAGERYRKSGWFLDLKSVDARFGSDEGRLLQGVLRGSGAGAPKFNLLGAAVRRGSLEVAVLYSVLDDKYFVRDYRGALLASAKSLRILSERDMRKAREALEKKISGAADENAVWVEKVLAGLPPGWTSHRTDNYVIVYDRSLDAPPPTGRPDLIPRIGRQLEALRRDIYEPLFPADEPVTAVSIVKVTQDRNQYLSYGAPPQSAGYWSWPSRELVFYYEQGKALDVTLPVLNHEAFHQYIFYAVGQVSPHSWFNEGHGDYFAGFTLLRGKFREEKFAWRQEKIRRAIESGTHVPLGKFLSFDQREYYGGGKGKGPSEGSDAGQNYAQGWSLVWFLRTTRNGAYQGVLDRYFRTLKSALARWKEEDAASAAKEGRPPLATWQFPEERNAKAMEEALQAAFDGIDLQQLERDWIASKPY